MKHNYYTSIVSKVSGIGIVLCLIIIAVCSTTPIYAQKSKPLPSTEDSLSLTGTFKAGFGRGSLDVRALNQSLTKSKLNTIADNTIFVDIGGVLWLWKGLVLDYDINYQFSTSSETKDKDGNFLAKVESVGTDLTLGYTIVNNQSIVLIPSIGLSTGYYATDITYDRAGAAPPSPSPGNTGTGIREGLVGYSNSSIFDFTIPMLAALKIEGYYKVKSFAVAEEHVAFVEPNKDITIQTRNEIWLGGYLSYYSPLQEVKSTLASDNSWQKKDEIGYSAGGINVGLHLVWALSMRQIFN